MARIHRITIQKDLYDPDNYRGVVTHLEPDILECEVNWALGSIAMNKASGGDGISAEFHSIYQQILKTQQWPQNWKSCFHSNPKERNAKECQNYYKIVRISC